MSSYTDYDLASAHYDTTRDAAGVEFIAECLAAGDRPLAEVTLVDAGCGTGNYARALAPRVARVEAVDLSRGMLDQARAKISAAGLGGRVTFHHASIEELPLDDASVDAIMVNQVLHHLPEDPDAGYPTHRRVIAEFARVLAPGGVLVINTSSREQLTGALWYADLIPTGFERMCRLYAPIPDVLAMLDEAGFTSLPAVVPRDVVMQGEEYFDPRGPLRAEWRHGDSVWSLVPDDELAAAQARIRAFDARGELDDHFAELDSRRAELGQITLLPAVRRPA